MFTKYEDLTKLSREDKIKNCEEILVLRKQVISKILIYKPENADIIQETLDTITDLEMCVKTGNVSDEDLNHILFDISFECIKNRVSSSGLFK